MTEGSSKALGSRCLWLARLLEADGDEDGAADGTAMTWSISSAPEGATRKSC